MNGNSYDMRPFTLVEGNTYLLRMQGSASPEATYFPVVFVNFDSCPAMVIVKNSEGHRFRCTRADLFSPSYIACVRQRNFGNVTSSNSFAD